jgi:hypothetical protein
MSQGPCGRVDCAAAAGRLALAPSVSASAQVEKVLLVMRFPVQECDIQ